MLYASQQCSYYQATPEATWIDNAQQLEFNIKNIQRDMPGGKGINLSKLDYITEIAL